MPERESVHQAAPKPCSHCPWRIENQGKRHPGGWYTKANLRRLWAKLRRGESMTCHPTDPANPLPEGWPAPPPAARTLECAGSLILQQREFMRFQECMVGSADSKETWRKYRARHPRGLTLEGMGRVLERAMFGGTPIGGLKMRRPNLEEPGIGHPDLTPWTPGEIK